jgi:hypothetical protein
MFSLRKPSEAAVRHFISSQENLPFSYEKVGASREGAAPRGYAVTATG